MTMTMATKLLHHSNLIFEIAIEIAIEIDFLI